jgi:hypothetical protein
MFRHRKTKKRIMRRVHNKKSRKSFKGGAVPDIIAVMKSFIPANHTVSMNTGSGLPTKASTNNPFTKGGTNLNKLSNKMIYNTEQWRERARENLLDKRLRNIRNSTLNNDILPLEPQEKPFIDRKNLAQQSLFDKRKRRTERRWKNAGKKAKKSRKKHSTQKGGLARNALHKTWVCRGNIGCANNINVY